MRDLLIWSLQQARRQTLALVDDLRDDQICLQTPALENHPAWILGHLLLGDIYLLSMLGASELSPDFMDLLAKYGPASKPSAVPAEYQSKLKLVERLVETNDLRLDALGRFGDLSRPLADETLVNTQPTFAHHLQILVFHEGHHCGQIASWRKAHGFPVVKGLFAS